MSVLLTNVSFSQSIQNIDLTQGFLLKTAPLSFGGAFRALADTNAAILYNPAGIAQKKGQIMMAADYLRVGRTNSNVISISGIDSNATELATFGISYDRDTPTVAGVGATVQQITFALAQSYGTIVYGGASIKGYLTQVDSPGFDGPDGVDIDLGVLCKPMPFLSVALTGQNLIQGGKFEEFPRVLGLGTALFLPPYARLAIDMIKDFSTPQANTVNAYFGGELRLAEGFFFRSGFGLDRVRNNNFYSLGASVVGPKISLLFTFAQHINPTDETYGANVEFYF